MPSQESQPGAAVGREDDQSGSTTVAVTAGETRGTMLGRYRLLEKIGEGGMGEVWLAEQKEPVRRRVAIKLIKAGMNTREVMARFESERQALALMDHPAIARVLDAGSTPQGMPYFVMEYVAGVPITGYCDKHRLSIRERLELFVHVCEGVQHAHQKAIIHRDLKPSNILVTEVDGHPAPKIIDFGVAKALAQKLTSDSVHTRIGTLIGTPEYVSPEQALSAGEDIDTRSDIYSLGIILYELLAGGPPLELRKAALDEFLRKLREDDAPRPSVRMRTQDPASSTEVARRRQTESGTLVRQIRGELDAIALKALEKDRSRRYASASGFAADIGRYLRNEPVLAVAPSLAYRARKFTRRYRAGLITASLFALVLVAAALVSIRQSIRASREAAVAQAVNDFLQNDLLAQASPDEQSRPSARPDPNIRVRTLLDRAAQRIEGKFGTQPEVEASIRTTIGQAYMDLGVYPEAQAQFARALDLDRRVLGETDPKTLRTMHRLGWVNERQGKYAEAEALFGKALEVQSRVLGTENPDTVESMNDLAGLCYLRDDYARAEALYTRTLDISRRVSGPEDPETLSDMNNLANVYSAEAKYAQAEALYSQALEILLRVRGPEHSGTLRSMEGLADVDSYEGKYAQAEPLHSQIVEIRRRLLGPENPETLRAMSNLAADYGYEGRYPQAEALFRQTLEIKRRVDGPEHPSTLYTLADFAAMYQQEGQYALAENYAAQALAGRRHTLGNDNPDTMEAAADLALAYLSQKKFAEAAPLAREAAQTDRRLWPDNWLRFRAESLLGLSLAGEKRYAEAEPLLVAGYQGMLARKDSILAYERYNLELARRWLVQLYTDWGKPDKAADYAQPPELN